MKTSTARKYVQDARAASATATGERILESFMDLARERWLDEVTLDEVARLAGVSVQTVIRRYGGKEGLLHASIERIGEQVRAQRSGEPGQTAEGIEGLLRDYEQTGDIIVRLLAQEPRHPALKPLLDTGRAFHRAWVETLFAPFLERLADDARERRVAALIILTDVYAWQLLRRDQRRSFIETRSIIEQAVGRIIGEE